ncbi:LysR family transcriptional regulator [Paraburkholderia fungorum]|jgi:DNA-binding transcriptional LysR family regulator|uniref:LysR family transcriptional regulator n=1 Tax=Paraburkholderia fungorum TaxID=134537 RepID=UPI0038BA4C59
MEATELNERDLRSLRVFCAAARASGFAAAERALSMSKASISRHINDVEARLGLKLCERGPGGFQLTEGGKVALRVSLQALEALDRIKPEVDAVRGVLSGPLVLGMSEHVMTHSGCRIPKALCELQRIAPLVRPTLSVMTFSDLGAALVERRVQIAIRGNYQRMNAFRHYRLFVETHRVFYCPATAGEIRSNHTRPLPLIYRPHPFVEDALATHGFLQGPEVSGLEAVAMMVATGQYVGLLPEHYAAQLAPRYEFVALAGSPVYSLPFCAIVEEARPLTRSVETFLKLLVEAHG